MPAHFKRIRQTAKMEAFKMQLDTITMIRVGIAISLAAPCMVSSFSSKLLKAGLSAEVMILAQEGIQERQAIKAPLPQNPHPPASQVPSSAG